MGTVLLLIAVLLHPFQAYVTCGVLLPALSFPFSQQPLTGYNGGTTKQVAPTTSLSARAWRDCNYPGAGGAAGAALA